MGGIPKLKFKRCCFCTRKLKVACILIVVWSMLITCHSIRILFYPACYEQYSDDTDFSEELNLIKWVLFGFNMVTLCSSFAYLLGLFWGYRITADVFMFFGFVSAVTMVVHAVYSILQIIDSECNNPSDVIAHIIYATLWCYFILIVNSHRDNM